MDWSECTIRPLRSSSSPFLLALCYWQHAVLDPYHVRDAHKSPGGNIFHLFGLLQLSLVLQSFQGPTFRCYRHRIYERLCQRLLRIHRELTYPAVTLAPVMDMMLSFLWQSLARPKSEILGHKSSSRRMFWGFISKCTILVCHNPGASTLDLVQCQLQFGTMFIIPGDSHCKWTYPMILLPKTLLFFSKQNPKSATTLIWEFILMLVTSLMNSSPFALVLLRIFTARRQPLDSFPLNTTPIVYLRMNWWSY